MLLIFLVIIKTMAVLIIVTKITRITTTFHFCFTAIKNKLFIVYFNNIYTCALWVNCKQFVVAYNNSYWIFNRLSMRCSASHTLAAVNVNSCKCIIRKAIYILL